MIAILLIMMLILMTFTVGLMFMSMMIIAMTTPPAPSVVIRIAVDRSAAISNRVVCPGSNVIVNVVISVIAAVSKISGRCFGNRRLLQFAHITHQLIKHLLGNQFHHFFPILIGCKTSFNLTVDQILGIVI